VAVSNGGDSVHITNGFVLLSFSAVAASNDKFVKKADKESVGRILLIPVLNKD
jgi:hypothetical protein